MPCHDPAILLLAQVAKSVISPMWIPRASDRMGTDQVGVPSGPGAVGYIGESRFW